MTEGATSSSQLPQEFSAGFAQRHTNPLIRPLTSLTQAAQTEPNTPSSHLGRRIARPPSRPGPGPAAPAGDVGAHFASLNRNGGRRVRSLLVKDGHQYCSTCPITSSVPAKWLTC